jgi:hypothetical protein
MPMNSGYLALGERIDNPLDHVMAQHMTRIHADHPLPTLDHWRVALTTPRSSSRPGGGGKIASRARLVTHAHTSRVNNTEAEKNI